jgi:hypothetical protein
MLRPGFDSATLIPGIFTREGSIEEELEDVQANFGTLGLSMTGSSVSPWEEVEANDEHCSCGQLQHTTECKRKAAWAMYA